MTVTENGWAHLSPGSSLIVPLVVAGRSFPGGVRAGSPKTLLTYVAAQYHLRVESLYYGTIDKDDWGYSDRPPSNHASATAIDVNASTNPQGVSHSHTYVQELAIRAILKECSSQIRWGRDYVHAPPDPMHFELAPGTTLATTASAANKLLNPWWWHRDLYLTGSDPAHWMRGEDVGFLQRRLGFGNPDKVLGPVTAKAIGQLEARLMLPVTRKVTKARAFYVGV